MDSQDLRQFQLKACFRLIKVAVWRKPGQLCRYSDRGTGWTSEESQFASGQGQDIFSYHQRPDWLCGPPTFLLNGYRSLVPWIEEAGREAHLHLVPRLRMHAAVPSHVFIACRLMTLWVNFTVLMTGNARRAKIDIRFRGRVIPSMFRVALKPDHARTLRRYIRMTLDTKLWKRSGLSLFLGYQLRIRSMGPDSTSR
jgi:hypothetical protein